MCDNLSFKLCTCEKVKPNQSYWTIKRFINSDWTTFETGRCFYPNYQNNDKEFIEMIGILLNSQMCFDNEFKPANDDVLNLTFYQKDGNVLKAEFEFKDNEWQHNISISEHLNNHTIIYRGIIEIKDDFIS